jgi:TPR repeat protein
VKIYVLVMTILWLIPVSAQGTSQQIAALHARAQSGDSKAEVQLGMAYASGDGVAADEKEAVKWFRRAAEKGNAAGEYSLAEMYLTGRGVEPDISQAVKWLSRAAESGDARAQFNLAALYVEGQGVSKNKNEAVKWMRKAADQGLAAGQFGLGSMYEDGRGVAQNEIEAANWYRKAGAQGDFKALNNLALMLATSQDAAFRNPKEAITVAQKAVDASGENPACLDTLATAYYEVGQSDKAAETERRALALKPDNPSYKKALEKYEAATRPKQ